MLRRTLPALAAIVAFAGACSTAPAPPSAPASDSAALPQHSNGLTAADREQFYHLSEGGELYPIAALLALEYDGGTVGGPLTSFTANLERYGLIADAKSDGNPYGLPVGVSVAPSLIDGSPMMGLNCAACHVGQVTRRGRAVRLDGAPSLVYVNRFLGDLADQTKRTLEDSSRRRRFLLETFRNDVRITRAAAGPNASLRDRLLNRAVRVTERFRTIEALLQDALGRRIAARLDQVADRVSKTVAADSALPAMRRLLAVRQSVPAQPPVASTGADADAAGGIEELASHATTSIRLLRAKLDYLKSLGAIGASITVEDGYGRVDAFDVAHNLLFGSIPGNLIAADAPTSFPHLWGIQRVAWLQWGSNMSSVMERNIGQSLGVGAVFDAVSYDTTSHLENLNTLEHFAYKLTPPVWPADVLGPIDEAKAERGRHVYATACAGCHEKPLAVTDTGLVLYRLLSLSEVGTDPSTATNFDKTVRLTPGGKPVPFGQAAFTVLEAIKRRYYQTHNVADAVQAEWEQRPLRKPPIWAPTIRSTLADAERWDDSRGGRVYAARPLAGIWATAPYLHNGSVPTLLDLLSAPEKRPKVFVLGTREYDPIKLGYVEADAGGVAAPFVVDTTVAGNRNTGHVYGTDLPDSDKADLIEFMKRLGPADFPAPVR